MKLQPLFRTLALSCVLSAAFVAAPTSAHADDDEGYPLVFDQRPIVLTAGLSQIEAAFGARKIDSPLFPDVFLRLDATFDYGVTDNLTVGILAVPLALTPEADYGNPRAYARFRLIKGPVEVGVALGVTVPVNSGSLGVDVGLVARLFLNKAAYLNIGGTFGINFATGTPLSLSIPVDLGISLSRNLFLTVASGFNIPVLDNDFWAVPLGAGVGYTLEAANGGPMADLFLKFNLPFIVNSNTTFDDMTWEVFLGGRLYL